MSRAYHYIRGDDLRHIWAEKYPLRAWSPLVPPKIARRLEIDVPRVGYLFCFLNDPEPESWVRTGWLKHLKNCMKNNYGLLSFDIENEYPVYVLDSTHLQELWEKSKGDFLEARELGLREVYIEYMASRVPLEEYDGSYEISEFIIAQDIPFSELVLEKIPTIV
jgi:hypothetical protein